MPVAGSLAVVILIAALSAKTVSELNEAVYWRKRTLGVLLKAQSEEDNLINAQASVHRFAVSGSPNLLIEYQIETNAELREFNKLTELIEDNPAQQQRLKELDAAVNAVFDHDNRVIGVYARQGSEAAQKLEGEGADVLDTAVKDLEKFKDSEKKLLDQRDVKEQLDFHKATHVLIAASIVAAILLVLANFFIGREMTRRRNAEIKQRELIEELQKALADVKTLSGFIPICAWCKNVRSDQGFWHSVEHYVTTHTLAKFSHGMCPTCVTKWEADLEANPTGLPAPPERAKALASLHGN